jgi:hypothetical protein
MNITTDGVRSAEFLSPRGTHRPERSLQRCIDPAERRNALWLVMHFLLLNIPNKG